MSGLLPPNSIIVIYFFYGLAFFTLGLAMALEARRLSSGLPFARAVAPLAVFGLIHGAHEWLEMFSREAALHGSEALPLWLEGVRVALLAISFAALIAFGIKLLYPGERLFGSDELVTGAGMLLFWLASVLVLALIIRPGDAMHLSVRSWLQMADTWSRYSLAIPGALLSGYALWRQARALAPAQRRFARYLYLAAAVFFVYGPVGQLFVTETYLFPSNVINAALFERVVGVPIQFLRAMFALVLALTLIPALNMFELERRQALLAAQQRAHDELARREALRRELLRHTVSAQEEERRRIARELHDEIGQTLTALSLGLESLLQQTHNDPAHLSEAISDLRHLTTNAVSELGHLVTDLRPSQLDHLGLTAAIRSLAQQYRARFGLEVDLRLVGQRRRLPTESELAVFRIAQEALTNVARHAQVGEAQVELCFEPDGIGLTISDQGLGFTPPETPYAEGGLWGLLGMSERATQLGGTLTIEAAPGRGTRVVAWLPLAEGGGHDEQDRAYSAGG